MSNFDEAVLEELVEQAGLAAIYRRDHAAAKQQLADADKVIAKYIQMVQEQAERIRQLSDANSAYDKAVRELSTAGRVALPKLKINSSERKQLSMALVDAEYLAIPF